MKNIYLLILLLTSGSSLFAQTSNWDFETWTASGSYDDLNDWGSLNQFASALGMNNPVEKITSGAAQGFFAAKIITNECANCAAIIGPGTDTLTGIIQHEVAYTAAVPQTATFMYKYSGTGSDVGLFYIELTKWDAVGDSAIVVAAGIDTLPNKSTWFSKIVGLSPGPGSGLAHDSIKVSFFSSAGSLGVGNTSPQVGSSLSVDALSLDTQVSINEYEELDFKTVVTDAHLNIDLEGRSGEVELIDLTGKILFSETIEGVGNMNISNVPSGIYLVKCNTEFGIKTNKVFIK